MATDNIEDIANLSDDELEARQRAADGESADHNPEAEGEDPPAEQQASTTDAAAEPKDPEPEQPKDAAETTAGADGKPEGVASKDGTRVLPYGALQAARRDARRAETRAERAEREAAALRQQIEDLKAGKAPGADEVTEADVIEAEANFPEHGKKMRALFNEAQKAKAAAPAPAEPAEPSDDPVQEAIDLVPQLVAWQAEDAEKFARAVEHDAVLMKSPKWKDRPAVERFAEATRRTCEEYDLDFNDPFKKATPSSTTAPSKEPAKDPAKAAIEKATQATRATPSTLSDLKGGSVPDHGELDLNRMSATGMLNKFMDMDPADIDRHLEKLG